MEVLMVNKLVQHTLRSLCCSYSDCSKWTYAVFWRILPRNYPPPKWDHGGGILDKRNWILVWEDGFCDFCECEGGGTDMKGRFGADIFFKMTHEVYNLGEGFMGKVAADKSHKWVFRDEQIHNEQQPRAWESQFESGIQTIAIVSVSEGIIQLGSFHKAAVDLKMVANIQRKFSYLQSISTIYRYTIQRPYCFKPSDSSIGGLKRIYSQACNNSILPLNSSDEGALGEIEAAQPKKTKVSQTVI